MATEFCDEAVTTQTPAELLVLDTPIVASFVSLLQAFSGCFTAPSMATFTTLMAGWVLDLRRHTVTEVVRAAGAVGRKHISSYHRFFSRARWTTDEVGLTLASLVVERLCPQGVLRLVVDDTLGRHTGKCIAAASMHRDPLLSTGRRPFFHWRHVWVVLAIEIRLFENATLIKARPANVTVIGRGRLDAALYAPAPKRRPGQKGRSRVRGKRLASPAWWASRRATRWKKLEVTVYGRTVIVRAYVIDALWYVASGSEVVRLVLIRDFPGHEKDDVFVCTDPTLPPRHIIESFSKRWSLEVTFHDAKGKLGFEDPQNRIERAVERTAPMALIGYSLTVLWYVQHGQRSAAARHEILPWYAHKAGTTFSDMLATLRRASWREQLFDPASSKRDLQKRLRPLVDYVASAA